MSLSLNFVFFYIHVDDPKSDTESVVDEDEPEFEHMDVFGLFRRLTDQGTCTFIKQLCIFVCYGYIKLEVLTRKLPAGCAQLC